MSGEIKRVLAAACGAASFGAGVVSTGIFSLRSTWDRTRILSILAVYVISFLLLEYGGSGQWLPRFRTPRSALSGMLRSLAGIVGVTLLLMTIGICIAFGPARLKVTIVGQVFGVSYIAISLSHVAITGKWFPAMTKPSEHS
jgi:hypothetical protein